MRRSSILIILILSAGCGDESPETVRFGVDGQVVSNDAIIRMDRTARADADVFPPDVRTTPPVQDAGQVVDAAVVDMARTPDASPPVDIGVPPVQVTRVAILGDVGKANDGQARVAAALTDACAHFGGCEFALLLGDNIYDSGAEDADDPQWQTKFEIPYADVDMPFYATLGNHDYGAPPILQDFAAGIGIDPTRGQAQLDYARRQNKFRMPASFYRFSAGPVEFVSLNTASLFWRDLGFIEDITGFAMINDAQEEILPQWAQEPLAPWRIAFGHHPYFSNGRHGNAGTYDFVFIPGLPGSGTGILEFMDRHVVGEFDVYLAGHDHNLQDLGAERGTQLFVSGAGASSRPLQGMNPVEYESEALGFFILEATEERLTFRAIEVSEEAGAARLWMEAHAREVVR